MFGDADNPAAAHVEDCAFEGMYSGINVEHGDAHLDGAKCAGAP